MSSSRKEETEIPEDGDKFKKLSAFSFSRKADTE